MRISPPLLSFVKSGDENLAGLGMLCMECTYYLTRLKNLENHLTF